MIDDAKDDSNRLSLTDRSPKRWGKSDWIFCIGIIVVTVFTSCLHMRAYPTLSPLDELQHIDYAQRAGHFDIPAVGERVQQQALGEAACRSVDAPGYISPTCNALLQNPDNFQERGFNTAASQFPTYYIITGLLARGVMQITPIGSAVTSLRVVSGIWLGIALCILWYVMALMNVPKRHRINSFLLLISTPLIVLTSSTVTPDSMLFLIGSVLLLSAIKYEAEKLKWYYFLPIMCFLFSIDRAVFLPILVIFIYLFFKTFAFKEMNYKKLSVFLSIPLVLYLMYFKIYPYIQSHLAPSTLSAAEAPMNGKNQTAGVDSDRLLQQIEAVVSPIWNVYIPYTLNTDLTRALKSLYNWFIIGALFALSLKGYARKGWAIMSGGTLVVMVLAGPMYSFYYAYFSNADYSAPGRFGLGLLPVAVVATSVVVTKTTSYVLASVLAMFSYSYLLWLLL